MTHHKQKVIIKKETMKTKQYSCLLAGFPVKKLKAGSRDVCPGVLATRQSEVGEWLILFLGV